MYTEQGLFIRRPDPKTMSSITIARRMQSRRFGDLLFGTTVRWPFTMSFECILNGFIITTSHHYHHYFSLLRSTVGHRCSQARAPRPVLSLPHPAASCHLFYFVGLTSWRASGLFAFATPIIFIWLVWMLCYRIHNRHVYLIGLFTNWILRGDLTTCDTPYNRSIFFHPLNVSHGFPQNQMFVLLIKRAMFS